ncbi:MAG: hypothetical protein K0U98_14025 [Deltaproteobacteria bacterium]|nr:hypothetical protein [Deltaproteobacteria bacterium]
MNSAKALTFTLALTGIFLLPTLSAVAESPTTPSVEIQPATEVATETPAETAETAQSIVVDFSDLEMDFLDLPKKQKKIRECEADEAAAAGCPVDRCIWASNRAWCF